MTDNPNQRVVRQAKELYRDGPEQAPARPLDQINGKTIAAAKDAVKSGLPAAQVSVDENFGGVHIVDGAIRREIHKDNNNQPDRIIETTAPSSRFLGEKNEFTRNGDQWTETQHREDGFEQTIPVTNVKLENGDTRLSYTVPEGTNRQTTKVVSDTKGSVVVLPDGSGSYEDMEHDRLYKLKPGTFPTDSSNVK